MVMEVEGLHEYMNLYNNGFAGGLAMLLIVRFIKGLKPHVLEKDWVREPIFKRKKISLDFLRLYQARLEKEKSNQLGSESLANREIRVKRILLHR